jgi:hypothetical protein
LGGSESLLPSLAVGLLLPKTFLKCGSSSKASMEPFRRIQVELEQFLQILLVLRIELHGAFEVSARFAGVFRGGEKTRDLR